jgi:hypothetical protein
MKTWQRYGFYLASTLLPQSQVFSEGKCLYSLKLLLRVISTASSHEKGVISQALLALPLFLRKNLISLKVALPNYLPIHHWGA